MSQNLCTPSNIYGPLEQTLFLGCSVIDYGGGVGWNEQSSTVTIHLVEDTCSGHTRYYWDNNLDKQSTTAADPGFYGLDRWQKADGTQYSGDKISASDTLVRESSQIIGAPVYFRVGNFEYSGLVQAFEQNKNQSGYPIYSVTLVSPTEILKNTRIIIGDYAGPVGSANLGYPYNVINAFGFMEQFGESCPLLSQTAQGVYQAGDSGIDGAVFGSIAGGFGGAAINDNGMQWNQIRTAINVLLNGFPIYSTYFSNHGRLIFKGPKTANYGIMPHDLFDPAIPISYPNHSGYLCEYFVDISEVPVAPSYWRLQGTDISLLDAISRICEDAGYDYYVELIPVKNAGILSTSGVAKFIKIRTVSRRTQPQLGQIQAFLNDATGTIDTKLGRELRNEPTTKFVIGGPKQTIYQINQSTDPEGDGQPSVEEQDDIFLPYFGLNSNGNVVIPTKDADGRWQFEADTAAVNAQLDVSNLFDVSSVTITQRELEMALGGYDSWMIWGTQFGTDIVKHFASGNPKDGDLAGLIDFKNGLKALENKLNLLAMDIANLKIGIVRDAEEITDRDLHTVYNWVLTFARDFYGRKFQVRVPYTCIKYDSESDTFITSEQPSDGGWTEVNNVIGLNNPGSTLDFFRLEQDNRIGNFVLFDNVNGNIFSQLHPDSYRIAQYPGDDETLDTDDDIYDLYLKVNVAEDFVYLNHATFFSPRIVIDLPQAVVEPINRAAIIAAAIMIFLDELQELGENGIKINKCKDTIKKKVAGFEAYLEGHYPIRIPDSAALALKSNINTYGPWVNPGPAGGVVIEQDNGLVPWAYGGYAGLNLAGASIANEGITRMQVGENGAVTVPGYPTIPLGAELGAIAGGFFGAGEHLIESRSYSLNETDGLIHHSIGPQTFQYGSFEYTNQMTGLFGANITRIDVQVGTQGTQTTYTMSTYTPKFGKLSRINAERIKHLGQRQFKLEKEQRRLIRRGIELKRISKQIEQFIEDRRKEENAQKQKKNPQSPHQLLVGEISSWATDGGTNDYRTAVASESIYDYPREIAGSGADTYYNKAFMSLDGLLRPVSMDGGGSGNFPQYYESFEDIKRYSSKNMQSPIWIDTASSLDSLGNTRAYNTDVHIDFLNPFSNPLSVGARNAVVTGYSNTTDIGHDINVLARLDSPPVSSIVMPMEGINNPNSDGDWDYKSDYRFLALRGPLVMTSWGYDIHGKPIPNAADVQDDIEDSNTFVNDDLQNKFLDNWLRNPKTWPVGPIDLRFDRARGVWTCPPSYRFVYGEVVEPSGISADGSGLAKLDKLSETLYQADGTSITASEIKVPLYDKVGEDSPVGTRFVGYYDVYDDKHYLIHKKVAQSGDNFAIDIPGCIDTGDFVNNMTWDTLVSKDGIVFGSGNNEGELDIGLDLHINDIKTSLNAERINTIILSTGISMTQDGCSVTLTAGSGQVFAIRDSGCITDDNVADNYAWTKLNAKDGIRLVEGEGEGELDIGLDLFVSEVTGDPEPYDRINTLVFRSGLSVSQANSCEIIIDSSGINTATSGNGCIANVPLEEEIEWSKLNSKDGIILADGGGDILDIGLDLHVLDGIGGTEYTRINTLIFDSGINVTQENSCELIITGSTGLNTADSGDGCITPDALENYEWNKLIAKDGIAVSAGPNPQELEIGLDLHINDTKTNIEADRINTIILSTGIYMSQNGCEVTLSASGEVFACSETGCITDSDVGNCDEPYNWNKLIARDGIRLVQGDNDKELDIGLDLVVAESTGDLNPYELVNTLIFRSGLTISQNELCEVIIDASGVTACSDTGCVKDELDCDYQWDKITARDGIIFATGVNPRELDIGLDLTVNDSGHVNEITFDCGFEVQKGDCEVFVNTTGLTVCFEVLTDVYCSGADIVGEYMALNYLCGLLVSTGNNCDELT